MNPSLLRRVARRYTADRGETGASLIIALAFLLVLSVILSALFFMAFTNIRAMRSHRQERVLRHNGDAALEMAVERLRLDPEIGTQFLPTDPVPTDCYYGGGAPQWSYVMKDDSGAKPILVNGAELWVTCRVSEAALIDPDTGEQPLREFVITVDCSTTGYDNGRYVCGRTGTRRTVATARVRFDVDYAAPDVAKRAVIPKVLAWNLRP